MPVLGTKAVGDVVKAITAHREKISSYIAKVDIYFEDQADYTKSFVAMLTQNWDDYGGGKIRTAGDPKAVL